MLSPTQDFDGRFVMNWKPERVALYLHAHLIEYLKAGPDPSDKLRQFIEDWCQCEGKDGPSLVRNLVEATDWLGQLERDIQGDPDLQSLWMALPDLAVEGSSRMLSGIPHKLKLQRDNLMPNMSGIKRRPEFDYRFTEGAAFLSRGGAAYPNPVGWSRLALSPEYDLHGDVSNDEAFRDWHPAYHGTVAPNLNSIMCYGLVPPGATINGQLIAECHGNAGAHAGQRDIYLSPSIDYSAHHIYTQDVRGHDMSDSDWDPVKECWGPKLTDEKYYNHFVFQVRVRPGSYRVQGNTLANDLWPDGHDPHVVPYDLKFGTDELEWLVTDPKNIRIFGLMYRQTSVSPTAAVMERLDFNTKARQQRQREHQPGKKMTWMWNSAATNTLSSDGDWSSYKEDVSDSLEAAFLAGQEYAFLGPISTGSKQCCYVVDLNNKVQLCTEDGEDFRQRSVRRALDKVARKRKRLNR